MSLYYKIDKESATVFYRVDGSITVRDLIALSGAAGQDPEYAGGMNGLLDGRSETIEVDISPKGIHELVAFNLEFPSELNHLRMAIVASSDLSYGLSRMMQVYAEDLPSQYSIFRDMAEACEWLGISISICDSTDGWVQVG